MLAKRPNAYENDLAQSSTSANIPSTESNPVRGTEALAPRPEPVPKVSDNVITVDFTNPPAKPAAKLPWSDYDDYEELFPTPEVEPTEAIATLTPALVNRRCYWLNYWPTTQVFRIKAVNPDNNTVYLNLIYRWVNIQNIKLLKSPIPTRPPKAIELANLTNPPPEEALSSDSF